MILNFEIGYLFSDERSGTLRRTNIFESLDPTDTLHTVRFGAWSFAHFHILGELIADEAFEFLHGLSIGNMPLRQKALAHFI